MGEPVESIILSVDEIEQNYAFRERYEREDNREALDSHFEAAVPPDIAALPPETLAALVSPQSHDLVLYFEVAGKDGYERRYKFPCWPKGASGITIGLGYDLGYNTPADVGAAWKPLLADEPFQLLARTVGLKGTAASAFLNSVRGVEVPWVAAESVYRAVTAPRFTRLALAAFPGARDLHPHCVGALFSLVYNRGNAMSGERRVHMRNIRDHIKMGRLDSVPGEFRAMKVIWPQSMSGLHKRRDAEGRLFEQGLAEMKQAQAAAVAAAAAASTATASAGTAQSAATAAAGIPAAAPPAQPPPPPPSASDPSTLERARTADGDWTGEPDDLTEGMPFPPPPNFDLERAPPAWGSVSWPRDDDNSTEYRHVLATDRDLKSSSFQFTADDLDLLIRANRFEPITANGRIVFGLRGAELGHAPSTPNDKYKQVDRAALSLRETRPDHSEFRCVIGVYNLETRRLSGFIASTVAKRAAVHGFATSGRPTCNLLPGGCYSYVVGRHTKFKGCLRENEPFAVMRNRDNFAFDVKDTWEFKPDPNDWPYDNIHPAFVDQTYSAKYSSLGCQTIRGSFDWNGGRYTGEYAEFRAALGLTKPGEGDYGKAFSYVLLTGLEAAIALRLREKGEASDYGAVLASLGRLRHGSKGEEVGRLQTALGMPATGAFDGTTKIKLAEKQKAALGWADGVLSPATDEALKTNVLKPEPIAVAVAPTPAPGGSTLESVRGGRLSELDSLYLELGRRAKAAETYPEAISSSSLPQYESLDQESIAGLIKFGKSAFTRVEAAAHGLICGDADGDKDQRQKLLDALGQASNWGPERVVSELATLLLTYLFIVPPINVIAARIIVEKILQPTLADARQALAPAYAKACSQWARDLQERQGAAPAVATSPSPASPASSVTV